MDTNKPTVADYLAALESGNIAEAVRLANLVDFIAEAPAIPIKPIDTRAADYAALNRKPRHLDFERRILIRDEIAMHHYV